MNIRKRRGAGNRQNRPKRNKPAKQANRSIFLYGAHPVASAQDNPARRCIALIATAAALKGLGGLTGRDDLSVTVAMRDAVQDVTVPFAHRPQSVELASEYHICRKIPLG